MTTPDVPSGRDELRERATKLAQGYLNYPQSVMLRDAIVALFDDLIAPQEAPAEGISLSAQLSQAAAWMRVWDECQRLGMDTYGAPSTRTGLDIVLDFIRGRAAPQEAREPELLGYVVERQHTPGEWVRVWRGSTLWFDHDEAVLERDAYALDGIPARIRPVYLGAPTARGAPEEGAGEHVVSDGRALTACWCGDIHMPPMRAAKEQGE